MVNVSVLIVLVPMRWVDPKGAQDNNMLAYQSVHLVATDEEC